MPKFTHETAKQMGAKGGQRTAERYGTEHMRRIAMRGFWATTIRHFNGNPRAHVNYLISLGIAATDPVPGNGAFGHDRTELRARALVGMGDRLRRWWQPPEFPTDMEPPF